MTITKKSTKTTKSNLSVVEVKKTNVPLIVEPHPKEYGGFPFVTLIQYRKQPMLAIIDNIDEASIKAFVLDLCGPEEVDEEMLIVVASEWYQTNRANFPISIEFSRRGITNQTSRIYRALNVEFVSRVIGPVPKYPMGQAKSIKRRRRKPLSPGVEIHKDTNVVILDQSFSK